MSDIGRGVLLGTATLQSRLRLANALFASATNPSACRYSVLNAATILLVQAFLPPPLPLNLGRPFHPSHHYLSSGPSKKTEGNAAVKQELLLLERC